MNNLFKNPLRLKLKHDKRNKLLSHIVFRISKPSMTGTKNIIV